MKKFISILLSLALTLSIGLSMVGCTPAPEAKSEASSFVSIDINPYLELTLDQNDKVMSVRGANEDGNVLLFDVELEGMSVENAVAVITDLARNLGYVEDNAVINTIVTSIDQEKSDKIRNKINNKITLTLGDCNVQIGEEEAYSLLRKWEKYTDEYPDLKDIIPAEKIRLAVSASETGVITIEEALTLDEKELIKIVSNAHKEMKDIVSKEAEKEYVKAKAEIEQLKTLLLDTAYTKFFIEKADSTMWYGATYQLYNTLAIGLESASKILNAKKDVSDKIISLVDYRTELQNIATALGVSEAELMQNIIGGKGINIREIETYANKVIKNNKENAETIKQELKVALADLETKLGGGNQFDIDDAGILDDIIENANKLINGGDGFIGVKNIRTYFPLITFEQEFDTWISEFETYIQDLQNAFADGLPTSKEFHELAKTAKERAKDMKRKIDQVLTKEDKAEIEEQMELFDAMFQMQKGVLETAINNAIGNAQDFIGGLRGEKNPK
ncbi:MAG: hypothetical protein IJA88_04735 [Clostridia bacterium]|nr:hypothetical protein [Clostridia bacterium]